MSVSALVAYFAFSATTVAYTLTAMILVAASLEAALGFCLGCKLFALLMRFGVIPSDVCEACRDLSLRLNRPVLHAQAQARAAQPGPGGPLTSSR